MEEIWKDIAGYEGKYQVSNLGRVRRLAFTYKKANGWGVFDYKATPGIARYWVGKDGYQHIKLRNNNNTSKAFLVHRLVAMAFVSGYQDGYDVNHIDENKQNNRADNLEWLKHVDNINHGTHNKRATAWLNDCGRKAVVQMSLDGQDLQSFDSLLSASKATGIYVGSIGNVCRGKCKTAGGYRWKYADPIPHPSAIAE